MPIFVRHDSQLDRLADLSANRGLYETGQDQFRNGLAADANARAFEGQRMDAQRAILADQRQREVAQANSTAKIDVRAMQDQAAMDRVRLQQEGATGRTIIGQAGADGRTGANIVSREGQGALNRDQRQEMFEGNLAERRHATDATDANADARLRQQAQLQQQRLEHEGAMQRARAAAAKLRADTQSSIQTKRAVAQATIEELNRQRSIVNGWVQNGDTEGWRRIAEINDEIARLTRDLGGGVPAPATQPAAPMAAPNGFDAQSYGQPGAPQGPAADAAQPPPPQVVAAVQGVVAQVAMEMPTASREAMRLEAKTRLMRMGIDPNTIGVR